MWPEGRGRRKTNRAIRRKSHGLGGGGGGKRRREIIQGRNQNALVNKPRVRMGEREL